MLVRYKCNTEMLLLTHLSVERLAVSCGQRRDDRQHEQLAESSSIADPAASHPSPSSSSSTLGPQFILTDNVLMPSPENRPTNTLLTMTIFYHTHPHLHTHTYTHLQFYLFHLFHPLTEHSSKVRKFVLICSQ